MKEPNRFNNCNKVNIKMKPVNFIQISLFQFSKFYEPPSKYGGLSPSSKALGGKKPLNDLYKSIKDF